ncbi:tRNA lysidine(34) synthetase TilS [Ferruginibacter sp. HRS2-29]|uniref:tRNA lysidine(34) synthetase TilS n=1 Tax=Ferruginibacter sp. HRS2-29 TaxID=2487334 RepID=UPI0020CC3F97|nr:tRNA lysidine(34) synthetase TilS [Ferruginibacter sp. HRS2-29]MCP9749842.1 tRNA lysidine(34) synthetase TilS [Ferruginibacter sp. HRS2-29]
MNLQSSFKSFIQQHHLFSPKDRLLVAVSGGVDSIVLCHLCKSAGYDFSIAHCNFQLRNEESEGDEAFVIAFAKELEVPVRVKRFDTEKYAAENKVSIQVAARELRYTWFNELLQQSEEDKNIATFNTPLGERRGFLLTAHHADDNMETILMNFFKGSGINGLKGILPKHHNIVRPLLFATKEDIHAYAKENNLSYREDSSNASDKYTRNYFRNQLIPALQEIFPQVKENLLDNAIRFREINTIYKSAIDATKKSLLTQVGNERHIPVLKLAKTPALHTVLYEIVKDFSFSAAQAEEVLKLLESESGKYVQSGTHRILRNRKWLIISPLAETDNSVYLLEGNDTQLVFPGGKLVSTKLPFTQTIDASPLVAQLSAKELKYPLIIRKWKQGDYFYPLGMQKKKKLSRFFIDQKLSLNQKENTWVVESDKKIIWIAGLRIDDRFKIRNSSAAALRLEFLPS